MAGQQAVYVTCRNHISDSAIHSVCVCVCVCVSMGIELLCGMACCSVGSTLCVCVCVCVCEAVGTATCYSLWHGNSSIFQNASNYSYSPKDATSPARTDEPSAQPDSSCTPVSVCPAVSSHLTTNSSPPTLVPAINVSLWQICPIHSPIKIVSARPICLVICAIVNSLLTWYGDDDSDTWTGVAHRLQAASIL